MKAATEMGVVVEAAGLGDLGDALFCFAKQLTDEFGYNVIENGVHVHDFNATILHLMGIDHERLTFKYQGRRFRLTDVDGEVVKQILA